MWRGAQQLSFWGLVLGPGPGLSLPASSWSLLPTPSHTPGDRGLMTSYV